MIFDTVDITTMLDQEFLNAIISDDPEMQKMVEEVYNRYLPHLLSFIEEGKEEGYIDREISVESIMVYFQLLKEIKLTDVFKEKGSKPNLIEDLTKLFFYGLLNEKNDY